MTAMPQPSSDRPGTTLPPILPTFMHRTHTVLEPARRARRWTPTAYGLAVSLALMVARIVEDMTGLSLVPDEAARFVVSTVLVWTLALWLGGRAEG